VKNKNRSALLHSFFYSGIMLSMLILGVETSCDDTSLALLEDGKLLSCITESQIALHDKYGGIIPELASREHQKTIPKIYKRLLKECNKTSDDISCIGATHGPGLMGSLLVGAQFARGLSVSKNIPHYAINHLEGHIFSCLIDNTELPEFPWIVLLVSGGHTSLIRSNSPFEYEVLGSTLDDAIGECFDKVARYIGLGYPGGPLIEQHARNGRPSYSLPRSFYKDDTFRFSYSGLKTATCMLAKKEGIGPDNIDDLCASFQINAFLPLIAKLRLALEKYSPKSVFLAGGVAANSYLRESVAKTCENRSISLYLPKKGMAMDNAGMIAQATYFHRSLEIGKTGFEVRINPGWRLGV